MACAEFFEEIRPLIFAHYKEIAHFQDIPLDPDFDLYSAVDKSGHLRIFTAREDDGHLIGYAVFFVRANIHYKSSIQAVQDIIYVDKERRGFGHKFILWCDGQLRDEGVQAVYHHVKNEHNFGPMLERLGYKLVDLIFTKRLDV
jgi:GNAT superfamily N-acetyltransferase